MRWLLTLLLFAGCQKEARAPVRVAAAADLSRAFEELGQQLSPPPVFSFGASGLLSKQLAEGAPFDVFAAANASFVQAAVKAGACDGATVREYARGRLAVWSQQGPVALSDLVDEKYRRVAIANPEVAPYGKAAKQALVSAGLWERLEGRLVFGENVRQTLQLAQTGNVEAAIVADALVYDAKEAVRIDPGLHEPLIQALVVCKNGGNRAGGEAFVKRVLSEEGAAVLEKYGFAPP